ncbi:RTF1 [Sanghuangporus sanghuang]
MSDSDGDFSDELLELAGAGEKKRKKTTSRSHTKRRKDSPKPDSEQEYESEDDGSNPYPLEGKFIDEADRERLLQMPEIERENIISQRMDEIQRFQDKRNLDQMLREQRGEVDSVSRAAKRPHQARGATEKKSRKLDELKAKRKAKSEKKRAPSPRRERSSSPVDMEMSSEDEEDGQVSKHHQEEERDERSPKQNEQGSFETTIRDMENLRVSREMLVQYAYMPWFEEFAKGSWVRILSSLDENKNAVYRMCEIAGVATPAENTYKVDDELLDIRINLRYGNSVKATTLESISNGYFEEPEFERLKALLDHDKLKLPSPRDIEKKQDQYKVFRNHVLTEADVSAMVERKSRLFITKTPNMSQISMERAELARKRDLAQRRRDFAECSQLNEQIAVYDQLLERGVYEEKKEDILTKINERNRQANREAVRRAEAAEVERKRKAWMARVAANSRPGTPGVQKSDTPGGSPGGTPKLHATLKVPDSDGKRAISPLPGKGPLGKRTFESIVANSVEIDLGDF